MATPIKLHVNGEVYRLRATCFNDIITKARELHGNGNAIFLKYVDTDGDHVTIETDGEFSEALGQLSPGDVLRVHVQGSRPDTPNPYSTHMQQEGALGENWAPIANEIHRVEEEGVAPIGARDCAREEHHYDAMKEDAAPRGAEESVHVHVTCDGCGASPIMGVRYKCSACPNFDLCAPCEATGTHDPTHVLIKIRHPLPPGHLPRHVRFAPWAGPWGHHHPRHPHHHGHEHGHEHVHEHVHGNPTHGLRGRCGMMRGCGPRGPHMRTRGPCGPMPPPLPPPCPPPPMVWGPPPHFGGFPPNFGGFEVPAPFFLPPFMWERSDVTEEETSSDDELTDATVSELEMQLQEMGFGNGRANLRAIFRHRGDLQAIVADLVAAS